MATKFLFTSILILAISFSAAKAQSTGAARDSVAAIIGKWSGSFDGAASGKFELVLNQDSGQKLKGQVIMLTDDGNRYPIDLKTVSWQKGQLMATYTDPSDGGEVSFSGNSTSTGLKGTWKSDGGQATGTWQVNR